MFRRKGKISRANRPFFVLQANQELSCNTWPDLSNQLQLLLLRVVFIRFLCSDSRLSLTDKIQLHVILNPICQIEHSNRTSRVEGHSHDR